MLTIKLSKRAAKALKSFRQKETRVLMIDEDGRIYGDPGTRFKRNRKRKRSVFDKTKRKTYKLKGFKAKIN